MNSIQQLAAVCALGYAARLVLINYNTTNWLFNESTEFNTPPTSYNNLNEAIFLINNNLSPYNSNIYHNNILYVYYMQFIQTNCPSWQPHLYILIDMINGLLIYGITQHSSLTHDYSKLPLLNSAILILNPITIIGCCIFNSASITHLFLLLATYTAIQHMLYTTSVVYALLLYIDGPTSTMILPPLLVILSHTGQSNNIYVYKIVKRALWLIMSTSIVLICVIYISYRLNNQSFDFINCHYIFGMYGAFNTQSTHNAYTYNHTPNIGVWWYFNAELFPRFRSFFQFVFHLHQYIYIIPLTIRFYQYPIFLLYSTVAVNTIFEPYPTLQDTVLMLVLLSVNQAIVMPYIRRIYLVTWLMCINGVMLQLMRYLWLYAGSGNANFYYFQTLLFAFTNCFVLIEAVTSVRKYIASNHNPNNKLIRNTEQTINYEFS